MDAAANTYGYPYEGETRAHLLSTESGDVEATLDDVVNPARNSVATVDPRSVILKKESNLSICK